MLNLKELKPSRDIRPPLMTLYGRPKIGKTTFGADAPNSIILAVEKGQDGIECAKYPIDTFMDMLEAIRALHDQEHDFKTVVVDSADWLELLVHKEVAREQHVKNIEDIGYGKGYTFAIDKWKTILSGLQSLRDNKNMMVIMIAHDQVKRYDNPMTESYDRYELKLHKSASALISEWSDIIAFATKKVFTKKEDAGFNKSIAKAKDGGRVLYLEETPAFVAGNRYGLPGEVDLEWSEFEKVLKEKING